MTGAVLLLLLVMAGVTAWACTSRGRDWLDEALDEHQDEAPCSYDGPVEVAVVGRRYPEAQWACPYPHDPADFRRCELLLRWVPVARIGLPAMRGESPVWAALIDNAQQEVSPA